MLPRENADGNFAYALVYYSRSVYQCTPKAPCQSLECIYTHFFIHKHRLSPKHQHGCQTTHGSLSSICKYSHSSVLIADCVPHTGGPLHRYLNIFMCLLTCARHHCPLRSSFPPPPRAMLTVIALFHLAKEQEFPWDPWQLLTDLEREIFHVFLTVIQRSLRWRT